MIELSVLAHITQIVIHTIVHWESLFGDKTGIEKKKEVWKEVLSKIYDSADSWMGLDAAVDAQVKEAIIPDLIDTIVALFNIQGEFTTENLDAVTSIVLRRYQTKGLLKEN